MSAAGRFPGGFIKREGRPSTKEILTSRLTDRPLRPLWPEGYFMDVQVLLNVYSADQVNDPDIVAMNAASASLVVSDLPFQGPVGSVRMGLIGERFIVCPSSQEVKESRLDLVISGTKDGIIMVEAGAREVSEEDMLKAFEAAQAPINALIEAQLKLKQLAGRPLAEVKATPFPEAIAQKIREKFLAEMKKAFFIKIKRERNKAFSDLGKRIFDEMIPKDASGRALPGSPSKVDVSRAHERVVDELVRSYVMENVRADGRGLKEIRPITIQLGILPRTHGSALFTRGETQALVIGHAGHQRATSRSSMASTRSTRSVHAPLQLPELLGGRSQAHPRPRPPRDRPRRPRRAGARRRSSPAPSSSPTPSASSATSWNPTAPPPWPPSAAAAWRSWTPACRSRRPSRASPSAWSQEKGKVRASSPTSWARKITSATWTSRSPAPRTASPPSRWTSRSAGISMAITKQALDRGQGGPPDDPRQDEGSHCRAARGESPVRAPHGGDQIHPDKIGMIIGPGGKNIRELQAGTGGDIEINSDDSARCCWPRRQGGPEACKAIIEGMTAGAEGRDDLRGRVVSIKEFGAFVEIAGTGQDGLVHVSEITDQRGIQVADFLKVGQEIDIKMVAADPQGRNRFSIKAARQEKGLPPLMPLNGGSPAAVPAGAPAGGGPGGEQRFRDSRPPRPGGPPSGPRPGGPGARPPGPPRRDL